MKFLFYKRIDWRVLSFYFFYFVNNLKATPKNKLFAYDMRLFGKFSDRDFCTERGLPLEFYNNWKSKEWFRVTMKVHKVRGRNMLRDLGLPNYDEFI